jgi:hypothetical protein
MSKDRGQNVTEGENLKYLEKKLTQCPFIHHKSHMDCIRITSSSRIYYVNKRSELPCMWRYVVWEILNDSFGEICCFHVQGGFLQNVAKFLTHTMASFLERCQCSFITVITTPCYWILF